MRLIDADELKTHIFQPTGTVHECYINASPTVDVMDKFEAVDKFRDALMDKFLELCNYNDYCKINLLLIGETVDRIYDKCIDDMRKEDV